MLLLHVISATVWTGGHLILCLGVLPRAMKTMSVTAIQSFEESFGKLGIPALIVQVLSGLYLAYALKPSVASWFRVDSLQSCLICTKLTLLVLTVLLAVHSRLRLLPKLAEENVRLLGLHIMCVTILAVAFVVAGVAFRVGGFP